MGRASLDLAASDADPDSAAPPHVRVHRAPDPPARKGEVVAAYRSWSRAAAVLALLAAGSAAALPQASAAAAVTPVVLRPDAGTVATQSADCNGHPFAQASPVGLSIDRGSGDDASQPLDVALTYSGTLVAGTDYRPLPGHMEIPAGTASVRTTASRLTTRQGTLTVTATGPAAPGAPATASSTSVTVPACQILPTAHLQVVVDRSFSVRLIDLFPGFNTSLARGQYELQSGSLPPGIAFASVYVSGTPTALGTFHGVVDGCISYQICVQRLTLDLQVVGPPTSVPGSGGGPSTTAVSGDGTAPPATPVTATSRFTG
ncbi:MAG: hypothetical protein JWN46_1083 [Acidimicrobiales bacterium]|nr:hypothetical protein [Acidimicrobiales bacterium]